MHITYNIAKMVGKTPIKIEEVDGEEIHFHFTDGSHAVFYHSQDCCESVVIEDVNGSWNDLIGNPILVADERVSHDEPNGYDSDIWTFYTFHSDTWTFYTFRGIGGSVDVRWHGSSNGYYSERVDFYMEVPE